MGLEFGQFGRFQAERFNAHEGAGDKTFKPSQNNELILGHKMPHPDWTGRVEIIQLLSQEEIKASCIFLTGI